MREHAPRFRSVPDDNCFECCHSIMRYEDPKLPRSSYILCEKFDFIIPYPASKHVCDDYKEGGNELR